MHYDSARHLSDFVLAERLADLLPEIDAAPAPAVPVKPEQRGFELPARVWTVMTACYGTFFLAMIVALGSSGRAAFAIAVAIVYVVVFFAAGRIVARQNPQRESSPLDTQGGLATWTGPMDRKAVYGQILIVPIAVALFGVATAIIMIASGAFA